MSDRSGKTGVVIIILVVVLAISAGAWYFMVYAPEQAAKEKARLEQIAQAAAEKAAAELAVKYDQLIIDGDTAFQQENWQVAQSAYSEASALFPDQQYPKDQLVLVNAKLDEMARRAAGIVEKISTRTGRYYVIISSSLDDDLAMDYAQKLAKEGNSIKIIEHDTGQHIFFRVSPGDYATLEQAEGALASFNQFSNDVWVLKY